MAGQKLASGGQAWFCTLGLPSDVVIEVNGMSFHLHKFPLMSKSRKLHELLRQVEEDEEEVGGEDVRCISIQDFPGGSETFEIAAKFCYGSKIEMVAATAAPLRCAAEFLEMTDEFADDNLISRSERFLSQSVFRSLGDSVKALRSCETLLPLAEDLGIPQRCIDTIVAATSAADARALFGWPVNDDAGVRRRNGRIRPSSSWVDDFTMLSLQFYKRLITAIRSRDPSSELIEGSLVSYAKRSIPGLSRSKRIPTAATAPSPAPEQMDILETIVTNLPLEKSSSIITTRFLFGLLRTAIILRAPEPLRTALEKKIASQLDQATLDDLLIPSYSYHIETLYDVDAVQRILRYYLEGTEMERAIIAVNPPENGSPASRNDPLSRVARLVDAFLAEVASDTNLLPEKFCDIAAALPDNARIYNDGLYRAIDIYLKAHPGMAEEEKEKVYRVLDCRKLTPEAFTHVAQNERLPLRAVVQALFFEQLQLRQAVTGTILAAEEEEAPPPPAAAAATATATVTATATATVTATTTEGGTWRAAARENQLLRLGMDSMKNRVQDLERECLSMRRAIERMDRRLAARAVGRTPPSTAAGWGSLGWRFGCTSRTQLRDSQAAAPPKRAGRQQSL